MRLNEFTEARVLFLLTVGLFLIWGSTCRSGPAPASSAPWNLSYSLAKSLQSVPTGLIASAMLYCSCYLRKKDVPLQLDQFLMGQDHVLFAIVASVLLLRDGEVNQHIFKWSGPACWGWGRAACFPSVLVLEGKCLSVPCFWLRQSKNWV